MILFGQRLLLILQCFRSAQKSSLSGVHVCVIDFTNKKQICSALLASVSFDFSGILPITVFSLEPFSCK